MIRHSLTTVSTKTSSTTTSAGPVPPPVDTSSTLRLLLAHLIHTIFLLLTATKAVGNGLLRLVKNALLSLDRFRLWIAQVLQVRKRWARFKDAVFYEFMLLLFQPSVLMLVVLWPGWVLVIALWLWSS
jgi:hypothetical protein